MKKNIIFCILIILILSTAVFAMPLKKTKADTDLELEKMTGQMLLIGFDGNNIDSQGYKAIFSQLESGEIGGVIFFEKNIKNKKELNKMTEKISQLKGLPIPFISIDQEGGSVQRLNEKNGSKKYPSAMSLAQGKDYREAYNVYFDMAKELKDLHFNYNFGPCVDLAINPKSIISQKERAYSFKPAVVELFSRQFIKAHNKNGIIISLKHFPGHGSVSGDSHLGFVDSSKSWSEVELEPYRTLIENEALQTVMISHVYNANLDPKYPASLSYNVISKLLRKDLKYDGVVVTDDLDMKAIKDNYLLEETVIYAINAGADILLFSNFQDAKPELAGEVRKIVSRAVKDKKIPRSRIEESYARIIKLKKDLAKAP